MADIELTRRHRLGADGARQAVERVARELQQSVPFEQRWEGNALHVEGRGAVGRIAVEEEAVHVAVRLGLLLRPMRPALRREAVRLLDEHLR